MQYAIPTPCLLKSGDKSRLMNKSKLMKAFHVKFQQTLRLEYVVPICERTWNRHCCESMIIFALHNCESRPLWWWWWCHVIYSSAVKNGHTFRLCRWEDPPYEVRLARGVLRGEVSIASCLGYLMCGSSEATRCWGTSFCSLPTYAWRRELSEGRKLI